jgi:hypothetical protein
LSTSTPQPSPRAKPSAAASKVLQRPSGASMWALVSATVVSGEHIRFTPPASAVRDSPLRRLRQATCRATSEEEQAVSMDIAGPCRPMKYETRPEATLCALPEAM